MGEDHSRGCKDQAKAHGQDQGALYRIIVADARTKRDGRAIEEIGKYHPKADPSFIEVNSDRAQHWLSVGAQPTDPVRKILEITGDWQKFKGLPGAEGTLRTAATRADKKEAFAAALAESLADSGATTPKGGGRGRGGGAKAATLRPAMPRLATLRLMTPRLAMPRPAMPRLATPRPATPRLATPRRTRPRRQGGRHGKAKSEGESDEAQAAGDSEVTG